jgi:hypothetical protein
VRYTIMLLAISAFCGLANAQDKGDRRGPPRGGPPISEEQKACLDGKLGVLNEGERPDRETMKAAFRDCKIKMPQRPPWAQHRKHHQDEQSEGEVGQ